MNPEQAKDIKQDFNGNYGYIYCLLFKNGIFVQMNQIFSCAGDIVEKFPKYKLSKVKIYACCLGKRNSHKNFHFKYL